MFDVTSTAQRWISFTAVRTGASDCQTPPGRCGGGGGGSGRRPDRVRDGGVDDRRAHHRRAQRPPNLMAASSQPEGSPSSRSQRCTEEATAEKRGHSSTGMPPRPPPPPKSDNFAPTGTPDSFLHRTVGDTITRRSPRPSNTGPKAALAAGDQGGGGGRLGATPKREARSGRRGSWRVGW